MISNIKQERTIYCERLLLKIANKYCNKGLKYCEFTRKRNKANQFMKKYRSKI